MNHCPQTPLFQQLAATGLRPLQLGGHSLLPIVQGGMGVGVSAHRLAGTVAGWGAVGTISSVDLRRHHPDLMERSAHLQPGAELKAVIDAANLEALQREIAAARQLSGGRGLLAVNVMRAVGEYAASVQTALQAGIDAVVVGAGLPLDLPDLARDHPHALLVPILSDARGVALLVKKWERKKRLPDAIVIEHPRWAGGHLGAARIADLNDPRFDFERVIPEVLAFLRSAGVEREVPLVPGGGVRSFEDIQRVQGLGAAAVQLGTPFVATHECDAHPNFKQVLAGARDDEVVELTSVAGLPARAVLTPWLKNYIKAEARLQSTAHKKPRCAMSFDCLAQCGLRDGTPGWGQFCIDKQLASALRGDVAKGLFFRGAGALPFGQAIVSVEQLLQRLLTRAWPWAHHLRRQLHQHTRRSGAGDMSRATNSRFESDASPCLSPALLKENPMQFKRLLVPVDGTELSDKAMETSIGLATQLGASIVGFVAEPMPPLPSSPRTRALMDEEINAYEAQASAHARPVLDRFAAAALAAHVPFEGVFDQVPRVDKAIVAAAESHSCDLIVMVTHGRGAFGEFLFGSQTKAVLAGSKLPLLVLH